MSVTRLFFQALCPLLLSLLSGCGDGGAADAGRAPPASRDPQADAAAAPAGAAARLRVLVLSGGGYHEFGRNLDALLAALAVRGPFDFTRLRLGPDAPGAAYEASASDQAARAVFGSDALRKDFDVVLAYTQGDLKLSGDEKYQLIRFVRGGGGFVGLHCAVDSHLIWEEYIELCGARFVSHPPFGPIHVRIDDAAHPITAGLPVEWDLTDEFYHLQDWEQGAQTVLMSGVSPAGGDRRPVSWCRPYGKGRVAVSILGHGPEVHGDARYQQLVAQALLWSAGR